MSENDNGVGLHTADFSVVVLADRNAAVARAVYYGGNGDLIEGIGSSKRENGDVHDPVIGHRLAIARALAKLAYGLADSTGFDFET